MHYVGYVFVAEPTVEAVAEAMEPWLEKEWDWYRVGGRWDGHLEGDEEMKRRETDGGFNFHPSNEDITRNHCKVAELPKGKLPYFFVVNGEWVAKEYYDPDAPSTWREGGKGAIVENPQFAQAFKRALAAHKDGYLVVVDAHN